ncbi:MAG: hypothetical protein JWM28_3858 [Chitinophagaceae bacterium]|nr:hypothetical protein [Chitinophagaceae bacterium]
MNSSWIDRIKQIELPPPEKGWDQIVESLDESLIGHEFPAKLYNYEINPPAGAWGKIEESVVEELTPVIPLKRGIIFPPFIRYAIAAGVIGLISFAAIKFFANNKTKGDVALAKPVSTPKNNLIPDSNANSAFNDSPAPAVTDKEAQAFAESKRSYARLNLPGHSSSNKTSASLYSSPALLSSS